MARPLSGIRVLDLTQVLFGPFATMLLSDMGAEVVKVERAGVGDIARGNGPFVDTVSTYFFSLNRGKQSITINLGDSRGVELFLQLAEKADILVENFTPGTVEKLGIDYETVRRRNHRIIYTAGSGFGLNGPYRNKPAFDVIIQAMGGVMSITGEENGPPVRPGVSYGDITGALFLCISMLAALQERERSGEGQLVDISMLDCQVAVQENAFVRYLNTNEVPRPLGTRHPVYTPFQTFKTADGYIAVALRGGVKNQWPLFCSAINRIDLIDDSRFEDGWERTQHYQELEPIMNEAMVKKTNAEWMKELEALDIPCGPLQTIPQVAADPQVQARQMFLAVEHPTAGKLMLVNSPFKFSRSPSGATGLAPELGEHNETVLSEWLGMQPSDIKDLQDKGVI